MGPRATNTQWYNQKQASCLGFGIYYKNENSIKCLNIDIISDCLEQDANAVIRAFEFIRNLNIFKKFESIKNYIIWSDCGKIEKSSLIFPMFIIKFIFLKEPSLDARNLIFTILQVWHQKESVSIPII
jgi:hypothetical protein